MSLLKLFGLKSAPWFHDNTELRAALLEAFEDFIEREEIDEEERNKISVRHSVDNFVGDGNLCLYFDKESFDYDNYALNQNSLHYRSYYTIGEKEERSYFISQISQVFSAFYRRVQEELQEKKEEQSRIQVQNKIYEEKAKLFRDIISDSGLFENSISFTFSNDTHTIKYTFNGGSLHLDLSTTPPMFKIIVDDIPYTYSLPNDYAKWTDPKESELINSFIKNRTKNV